MVGNKIFTVDVDIKSHWWRGRDRDLFDKYICTWFDQKINYSTRIHTLAQDKRDCFFFEYFSTGCENIKICLEAQRKVHAQNQLKIQWSV
jgi:hypothetical protein